MDHKLDLGFKVKQLNLLHVERLSAGKKALLELFSIIGILNDLALQITG